MRGDGVGIGHVDEVQGRARCFRDAAGNRDCGIAIRELDGGLVRGHGGTECLHGIKQDCRWGTVGDSTWETYGECGIHSARAEGADGMRGDGVGIGHVDEVQGRAGGLGDAAGGDDGRRAVRDCYSTFFSGLDWAERAVILESAAYRVRVSDDARDKHGDCGVHSARAGGADGMRGDGVGIGHVDEVQGRAGGIGDAAGGGDIWRKYRMHHPGILS